MAKVSTDIHIINTIESFPIPDKARYYCMIGKGDSWRNAHTVFHMGFIDETGRQQPLLEVGKIDDSADLLPPLKIYQLLTDGLESKVRTEGHLLRQECSTTFEFPINYSAYQINQAQYCFFLDLLKEIYLAKKNIKQAQIDQQIKLECEQKQEAMLTGQALIDRQAKLACAICFRVSNIHVYQPNEATQEFEYLPIDKWQAQKNLPKGITPKVQSEMIDSALKLSPLNNCRHTGLDFLNYCLGGESHLYQENAPSFYMMGMPCHTKIKAGTYNDPLYLLPLPPSAYQVSSDEQKILLDIYQRMSRLLHNNYNHPGTARKFELLNNLYNELVDDKTPELNFLAAIENFYGTDNNALIINEHRGWQWPFFEHQTTTRQMFNKFHKDYEADNSQDATPLKT